MQNGLGIWWIGTLPAKLGISLLKLNVYILLGWGGGGSGDSVLVDQFFFLGGTLTSSLSYLWIERSRVM